MRKVVGCSATRSQKGKESLKGKSVASLVFAWGGLSFACLLFCLSPMFLGLILLSRRWETAGSACAFFCIYLFFNM